MSVQRSSHQDQKTIDFFFAAKPSHRNIKAPSETTLTVPGLSLIPGFIDRDEEQTLLSFLDGQVWRTDLARRVIHYGGSYCLLAPRDASGQEKIKIKSTIITADPVPSALTFLIMRMVERKVFDKDRKPEYCIVNEYRDSQGISAHIENFKFDEPVCGLSLCHGDWMRFHELINEDDGSVRSGRAAKAERTGRKVDVWLPPRGLVIMRGPSRYQWQHEICTSKRGRRTANWKRTSLTFRVEKSKY